jgi:[ribosomal protein S5]-alanine N-acetyltransferase
MPEKLGMPDQHQVGLKAPERVETQRLVLRRPRPADAEAIFACYATDADMTRFLSWPRHESVDQTRAFLDFSNAEWTRWPAGPYLVESRERGRLLGGTGLDFETVYRAATGYVFSKDAWGKGYATEALQAVVEIARGTGLIRLYALCHIQNSPSLRVLEKCGFIREGVLRRPPVFPNLRPNEPCDVFCYAQILR